MTLPMIGYDNWFDSASVITPSSENSTSYVIENAYDWRADDWWKPTSGTSHNVILDMGSAMTPDCLGIAFHDLFTQGAAVTLRGSSDNFIADDNLVHTMTVDSDNILFEGFLFRPGGIFRTAKAKKIRSVVWPLGNAMITGGGKRITFPGASA